MWMHNDAIKKYPRCANLLQTLNGTLSTKERDAFLAACTADNQKDRKAAESIARQKALKWSIGPKVVVHDGLLKIGTDACGFQPLGPNFGPGQELVVTSIFFDAFEFGSSADHANNAERLKAIVLHEAVHWVRQEAKASDVIYEGLDIHEPGQFFERLAYGKVHCTDAEINDALGSMRK